MKYVALLRGINVGGNNKIKMSELAESLEKSGLLDVKTYIQSGNVIFSSDEKNGDTHAANIEKVIDKTFGLTVPTVVLSQSQLQGVIDNVPKGWLENPEWKYNYLFLKPPFKMDEVVAEIGELKPDIEAMTTGQGVIYQSMSIKLFGRTTSGKLASRPVYKIITIRNHNTVSKLLHMMHEVK